jgi:multimeric flavodoxin WrbA
MKTLAYYCGKVYNVIYNKKMEDSAMYIIITSSPNGDGLTAACGKAAVDGVTAAGGSAELIDISAKKLQPCKVCRDGWGPCRNSAACVLDDCLAELQAKIREAEGIFIVTPVYFGQPSERMKYFFDRFRRCEAFNSSGSAASGKQIDLIAAAGGSGNGTAPCLVEMETWTRQVGGTPQERIGVTRFNRSAALKLIEDAATRMVTGDYFKGF